MSRQYQIADLEKRMLKENQEDENKERSCPSPNAQLRGEQRLHPNLTHCTVTTKFEVGAKMPSVENPS
ncbi:hypothetical protein FV769_24270 [Vibrio parahaemolyticus]|nr:hypothetical protein [Vibrio parahaemolyticus]